MEVDRATMPVGMVSHPGDPSPPCHCGPPPRSGTGLVTRRWPVTLGPGTGSDQLLDTPASEEPQ